MLMTAAEYRESLRRLKPRVFVDGRAVASVADDPALQPGVNAVGLSYDFALRDDTASLMRVGAADEATATTACCTCRAARTNCCRNSKRCA
jgi:aromatic ring hydroxylase